MGFVRAAFLLAFGTLFAGFFVGRSIVGPLFSSTPAGPVVAAVSGNTPTPKPHHHVGVSPTAAPTSVRTFTVPRAPKPTAASKVTVSATAAATVSATATPTATVASDIVTLDRYWVGTQTAHPGASIQIGYVIQNDTGSTKHVALAASMKPSLSSWNSAGFTDPVHEVLVAAPPGVSTHLRTFVLPRNLSPGSYDVAWGLRDAATGKRDALTSASEALRIVG